MRPTLGSEQRLYPPWRFAAGPVVVRCALWLGLVIGLGGCVKLVDSELRTNSDGNDAGVADAEADRRDLDASEPQDAASVAPAEAGTVGDGCDLCASQSLAPLFPNLPDLLACCAQGQVCGLNLGLVDPSLGCEARDQPGIADQACPRVVLETDKGNIRLDGCCTPLGECGAWTTEIFSSDLDTVIDVGTGCVRNHTLPEGEAPQRCAAAFDDVSTPGHDGPGYVACGGLHCDDRCCLELAPLTAECGRTRGCDAVIECDGPEDCPTGTRCCNGGGRVGADRLCAEQCEGARRVCHTDDDCPEGRTCAGGSPALGELQLPALCE